MGDGKKILIIDDSSVDCAIFKDMLSACGFDVATAMTGQEALVVARERQPDLILLDIVMRGKSGSEISELLASDPQTRDIPIVFLTNMISENEEDSIQGQGGHPVLSKTSEPKELIRKVRLVLGIP